MILILIALKVTLFVILSYYTCFKLIAMKMLKRHASKIITFLSISVQIFDHIFSNPRILIEDLCSYNNWCEDEVMIIQFDHLIWFEISSVLFSKNITFLEFSGDREAQLFLSFASSSNPAKSCSRLTHVTSLSGLILRWDPSSRRGKDGLVLLAAKQIAKLLVNFVALNAPLNHIRLF